MVAIDWWYSHSELKVTSIRYTVCVAHIPTASTQNPSHAFLWGSFPKCSAPNAIELCSFRPWTIIALERRWHEQTINSNKKCTRSTLFTSFKMIVVVNASQWRYWNGSRRKLCTMIKMMMHLYGWDAIEQTSKNKKRERNWGMTAAAAAAASIESDMLSSRN